MRSGQVLKESREALCKGSVGYLRQSCILRTAQTPMLSQISFVACTLASPLLECPAHIAPTHNAPQQLLLSILPFNILPLHAPQPMLPLTASQCDLTSPTVPAQVLVRRQQLAQ